MKPIVIGLALAFISSAACAAPVMIVTCQPPKGINLTSEPTGLGPPEHLDPEASAYLSHPLKTRGSIITVNRDGTATDAAQTGDHSAVVSEMHIVGDMHGGAITFTEGKNDFTSLVTLYPKDGVVVFAGTSYFGMKKGVPTGYTYIAHCSFSDVIN